MQSAMLQAPGIRYALTRQLATAAAASLPVQPLTQAIHETASDIPGQPRLEAHFYQTLLPDLLTLNYRHASPHADLAWLERQPEWEVHATAPASLPSIFGEEEVAKLPTDPTSGQPCTSLLSAIYGTPVRPEPSHPWRKKLPNPIDYTSVPKRILNAAPKVPARSYSPLLSHQPFLHTITLKVHAEAAIGNKNILCSAIQSLTAITGVRAEPVLAKEGDNALRIRAGMPIGATVSLSGPRMWEFLDKMVQTVLPRIREWEGINPVVRAGAVTFSLPETAMGYFPEIEPHFDMYPRLFATDVVLRTHGRNAPETLLCLSGFQLPFLPAKVDPKRGEGRALTPEELAALQYKELGKLRTRSERIEAAKRIAASSSRK
jgi:ribosomal protein L5